MIILTELDIYQKQKKYGDNIINKNKLIIIKC